MQAIHWAHLLSQGLGRAPPEGLREHCDLHFSDTSCSCYFNCGVVASSQGKEWISGQKADSFILLLPSLIPATASNHPVTWKVHYNARVCQPGGKATKMKSNLFFLLFVFIVPYSLSQFVFPSFYLFLEMWRTCRAVWNSWVLRSSHLDAENQSEVWVTLLRRDWGLLSPLQHRLTAQGQKNSKAGLPNIFFSMLTFTGISSALPTPCIPNTLLM